MTDLRRYPAAEILSAAKEFRDGTQSDALGSVDLALALDLFRFRDDGGTFWFLDARSDRWYQHDGKNWLPADDGPGNVEGLSSLALIAASDSGAETTYRPLSGGEIQRGQPATEALAAIVRGVRSAYERGRISSNDAEELLGRQYVFDREGRAWTVGFRRDRWYFLHDREWTPSALRPPEESLIRLEAPSTCEHCRHELYGDYVCPGCGADVAPELSGADEDVYAALVYFLMLGAGSLPEAVTDPWDPPLSFPEALDAPGVPCPRCRASNPATSRFCSGCGAALGPAERGE